MEALDNILSGRGEATPAPEPTPVEETKPEVAQTPASTEPQDEVIEHQDGRKMVPLEALTETRGKVKRYTEQVAAFGQTLKECEAAWDRRFSELLQSVKQPAPQPEPQQEPPDFFADPNAAIKAVLSQNLAPLQSQLMETRTALLEERLTRIAGGEKAAKIEAEIGKAMQAGDPAINVLQQALRTQGPAAASLLVEWYDKRTFDPAAERERIKAEILAELRGSGDPAAPVQPAPVMPSNLAGARNVGVRSGPTWEGPKPLGDIFKR